MNLHALLLSCGLSYAEGTLTIEKPQASEKFVLQSSTNIPIKASITPQSQTKIHWDITIEETKYEAETDPKVEGNLAITAFPVTNSGFGENTIIAKAVVDTTPPKLEVKDSKGLIPNNGFTNKTAVTEFVDDYKDGSGIDKLEMTGSVMFLDDTNYGQTHTYNMGLLRNTSTL